MKSLVQYIREASEETQEVAASKTFTFKFDGLEGLEDFIKSVNEFEVPETVGLEVEENTVKVTVNKESVEDAEGLFELLQDFIELRNKDTKNSSSETYAIKTEKLRDTLNEWRDYVDDVNLEDEPKDDEKSDDKKEDEKADDKKEDKKEDEE